MNQMLLSIEGHMISIYIGGPVQRHPANIFLGGETYFL